MVVNPKSVEEGFPMSDKPYRETVKDALHDPVWWIRLPSAIAALIFLLVKLFGFDTAVGDVAFSVSMVLFAVTFFLEAVRGKNVGSDRPMGTVERVVSVVVSVFVMVVFFVDLLRSLGVVSW